MKGFFRPVEKSKRTKAYLNLKFALWWHKEIVEYFYTSMSFSFSGLFYNSGLHIAA